MIYLIAALDAEAKPLYEHFRLKRNYTLPYPVYTSEDYVLIVCGVGRINAAIALSALLGNRLPRSNDQLINIGVCAAPKDYQIGEALLIHQIYDQTHRYYPDILYSHPFRESACESVDSPISIEQAYPVDMESAGIFIAASRFFKLHNMAFLKIVSDHFQPENVTKDSVYRLISDHIPSIEILIASLKRLNIPSLFTSEEEQKIGHIKTLFTHAQQAKLDDALCYFRLRFPTRSLPLDYEALPVSKHERNRLHEQLIHTLVS